MPFYELLPNFVPLPGFPGFGDVRPQLDARLADVWAGRSSARDGLAEAARLGQQRLDEALR